MNHLKNKRLLLVDDEQELLYMVELMLKEDGYSQIQTAGSVKEAVAAKSFAPELAGLYVMLPDGNGFSLLEQLRRFTDLPVLFLTALGEDEDRLKGLGLGADDYLVKPFLGRVLLLRIVNILKRF